MHLNNEVNSLYNGAIKYWWKKLKRTQINRMTPWVYGLEEWILLKCPHYLNSRQSQLKCHWLSSQN
jgi:hypothetical protein